MKKDAFTRFYKESARRLTKEINRTNRKMRKEKNPIIETMLSDVADLNEGGKLLRGNRSVKVSADGLQAFDSPNYPPLAEAGIDIEYNRGLLLQPGGSFSPFHLAEISSMMPE